MNLNYVPKEISAMMGVIDTYLRHKAEVVDLGKRKYHHYHPSEWGKCLRLQQYKHYADSSFLQIEPNFFDSRMLRLFDKGHNMHNRWSKYFADIGILRGCWKCKNESCHLFDDNGKMKKVSEQEMVKIFQTPSRIYGTEEKLGIFQPEKCVCGCTKFEYEEASVVDKSLNIYGHCDLLLDCTNLNEDRFLGVTKSYAEKYLPKNGQVVVGDMKTISSSAWKNQLLAKGEHKYYVIQLTCYIHILGCDYGLLMYENKDDSHMKWYKVERNEEWWQDIQWQAKAMQDMAKSVDSNGKLCPKLPPPRPKTKSDYECKNCDFKSTCHASNIWQHPNLEELRKQFYKSLL